MRSLECHGLQPAVSWYLVHCKPGCEAVVEANLARQAYQVYYPRLIRDVRHGQGWRERVGSLFPRYLFVGLDSEAQSLGPVRFTLGVAAIVRFGELYAVVPHEIIDSLRTREGSDRLHRLPPSAVPQKGAVLEILCGPFSGLQAVFQHESPARRVVVLMDILGRCQSVELPAAWVVPGSAAGHSRPGAGESHHVF